MSDARATGELADLRDEFAARLAPPARVLTGLSAGPASLIPVGVPVA